MIIRGGHVFLEDGQFHDRSVRTTDRVIEEVTAEDLQPRPQEQVIEANGQYVIPGLVDIHFHGSLGHDICEGTEEAIQAIADYQLNNGIMTICPATMTYPESTLAEIMNAAGRHVNGRGADLRGLNMEGPFLSREKCGAQNPKSLQDPDPEMFRRLQEASGGLIRILDIAPELRQAIDCIHRLSNQVRVSLAHTAADYDTASKAFAAGASQVTHLYNAMPPFLHREPGVIGAAIDAPQCRAELICDGVHVHPSAVRAAFRMFGRDRMILISDSMMACGLEDGAYTLGGQNVTVQGKKAFLTENGALAGSVTHLMNCVRTAVLEMQIPLADAILSATVNPAKSAGIDDLCGSIQPGREACIVILNQNLDISARIFHGELLG